MFFLKLPVPSPFKIHDVDQHQLDGAAQSGVWKQVLDFFCKQQPPPNWPVLEITRDMHGIHDMGGLHWSLKCQPAPTHKGFTEREVLTAHCLLIPWDGLRCESSGAQALGSDRLCEHPVLRLIH